MIAMFIFFSRQNSFAVISGNARRQLPNGLLFVVSSHNFLSLCLSLVGFQRGLLFFVKKTYVHGHVNSTQKMFTYSYFYCCYYWLFFFFFSLSTYKFLFFLLYNVVEFCCIRQQSSYCISCPCFFLYGSCFFSLCSNDEKFLELAKAVEKFIRGKITSSLRNVHLVN